MKQPYTGVFAIIPVDKRFQAVIIHKDFFACTLCSVRNTPDECLNDIGRLTKRYHEQAFFKSLKKYNNGAGMTANTVFKDYVKTIIFNRQNILEDEINDIIVNAKAPYRPKAVFKKRRPIFKVKTPQYDMDWLLESS